MHYYIRWTWGQYVEGGMNHHRLSFRVVKRTEHTCNHTHSHSLHKKNIQTILKGACFYLMDLFHSFHSLFSSSTNTHTLIYLVHTQNAYHLYKHTQIYPRVWLSACVCVYVLLFSHSIVLFTAAAIQFIHTMHKTP